VGVEPTRVRWERGENRGWFLRVAGSFSHGVNVLRPPGVEFQRLKACFHSFLNALEVFKVRQSSFILTTIYAVPMRLDIRATRAEGRIVLKKKS